MFKKQVFLSFALLFAIVFQSSAEQLKLDDSLPTLKANSAQIEQLTLDDLLATSKTKFRLTGSISVSDFFKKFKNNPNLQQDDLQYFPKRLRQYFWDHADWAASGRYVGFSKHLRGATYLFNVTSEGWRADSHAVLVNIRGGASPQTVQWEKLSLPYLTFYKDHDELKASNKHKSLVWVERDKQVQTTTCLSHGLSICTRNSYTIFPQEHKLVRIELKKSTDEEWKLIWQKGRWVVDKAELFRR